MSDYSQIGNEHHLVAAVEKLKRQVANQGRRNTEANTAAEMVDDFGDLDYSRADDDGNEVVGIRRDGLNVQNPEMLSINFWASIGVPSNLATAIYALAFQGTLLFVGGSFTRIGGIDAQYIACCEITTGVWSNVGSPTALNALVRAIAVDGSNVYVGGNFTNADGIADADYFAVWDGAAWGAVGAHSFNNAVVTIAVSGSDVYVGGAFTNADGIADADYFAVWDGAAWGAVGAHSFNDYIDAIVINGSDVYAGGNFTDADGIADADYLAVWDGAVWAAVGSTAALNNTVTALAFGDAGLFVGGYFTDADGVVGADYVALWDGEAWAALGEIGLDGRPDALCVSGERLYAGGIFTSADGLDNTNGVAMYQDGQWMVMGSGGVTGSVKAFALYGNDLYVAGNFTSAGKRPSKSIAAYLVSLQSGLSYLETNQQAFQDALLSDVTQDNASTSKHGYLKKLPGDSTKFMNGVGNWAVPSGGGGGSLPYWVEHAPAAPPTSPSASDDEFDDSSGSSGPLNGLDASWSAFGSSQSVMFANACLVMEGTAPGAPSLHGLYKTAPSTPYIVTCRVTLARRADYNNTYLGFIDASSKLWCVSLSISSGIPIISVQFYNNITSFGGFVLGNYNILQRDLWLQIEDDGSNLIARWSPNGVEGTFEDLASQSYGASLTPDRFFIGMNAFSGNNPKSTFGPVRVT